jgi:two-component system nitrogen regulation response regulator GlnG
MRATSGLELLDKVKERYPQVPVIIMTAYSDLDSAVSAFQGGAFEYPAETVRCRSRDRAHSSRDGAGPASRAESGNDGRRRRNARPGARDAGGASVAIGRLSAIECDGADHRRVGNRQGAGRGVRSIRHSPRALRSFIAINTAAIPKDLLDSELFGHERGAFTGAQRRRRGRFEQAEGGTLSSTEIGDMPRSAGALLRVSRRRILYGSEARAAEVDSAVIAATHQNLEDACVRVFFARPLHKQHRLERRCGLRLPHGCASGPPDDIAPLCWPLPATRARASRRRAEKPKSDEALNAARHLRVSRQRASTSRPSATG